MQVIDQSKLRMCLYQSQTQAHSDHAFLTKDINFFFDT